MLPATERAGEVEGAAGPQEVMDSTLSSRDRGPVGLQQAGAAAGAQRLGTHCRQVGREGPIGHRRALRNPSPCR